MNLELSLSRVREVKWLEALAVVLAICMLWVAAYMFSTHFVIGIDWHVVFKEAARRMVSGDSPYSMNTVGNHMRFYNPPWALIPLIPAALLPDAAGQATMITMIIVIFVYVVYRMGASPIAILSFMLSIPVLLSLDNLNIEFLVFIGLILPPQIGLFFLVTKPQLSVGYILYLLYSTFKKGGIKQGIQIFGPIGAATLLSFAVYGFWPRWMLSAGETPTDVNIWPVGLVIGMIFLYKAFTENKEEDAVASSPFLSPYLSPMGWSVALVKFLKDDRMMILLCVASWVAHFLTKML